MDIQCDKIFESQTAYDKDQRKYTAHCGVCGKTESRKKWFFRSGFKTVNLLRLEFNLCPCCNRWVCEDCFLIDDGSGAIGICKECAQKEGITGFTLKELIVNNEQ